MAIICRYIVMISEADARAKILAAVKPLPSRKVPIMQALDCFTAEDYFAQLPLPIFDNSAMDGYAVIARDSKHGSRLRVIGEQPAGIDRKLRVSNGTTVRIFTGAPMPPGADAVVMQEDVTRDGDEIVLACNVDPGDFVRKSGCDLADGQKILSKGDRIDAIKLALLASQGFDGVCVGGKVRVSIVSTGDELAKPGDALQAGQIYDSNAVLLQSLVQKCNAAAGSVQHCRDNPHELRAAFQSATANEILIVTGGVSVGEHDLVQSTLRQLDAKIEIWRVAIKPGKPFLFGSLRSALTFGLPGNPVSAFVTFLQFVRPAILRLMGATQLDLPEASAKLVADEMNESERPHYLRGKFENGNFTPVGRQESHALYGLSESNALLRVEVGQTLKAGEIVQIGLWS